MSQDTMYCSKCERILPLAMFFNAEHNRYLAFCGSCRAPTPLAVVKPPKPQRVVNLSASRKTGTLAPQPRNNIRLVEDAAVA